MLRAGVAEVRVLTPDVERVAVVVAVFARFADVEDEPARAGADTLLLRVLDTEEARDGVLFAVLVRVVTDVASERDDVPLVPREEVATLRAELRVSAEVLRDALAPLLRAAASWLRVRILVLPNEREAFCAFILRVETPAAPLREDPPCATALRVLFLRSDSKARALLAPREAFRVEKERSG